jgi:hypothetical protein
MRVCLLFAIIAISASQINGRPNLFGNFDLGSFFNFPSTRRGRATAATTLPLETGSDSSSSVSVSKNSGEEANIIAKLIENVMQEVVGDGRSVEEEYFIPVEVENQPKNIAQMKDFGSRLGEFDDIEGPVMNLQDLENNGNRQDFLRQNDPNEGAIEPADDDAIRCIPKVMQVEETVYDRAIKCHHSYQEKCHMTYITDYRSTSEEKCETTYKKNCQIIFKPMPFNETVRICQNPLVRSCSEDTQGPEICNTHYETSCETTYKTYEVEQDEPVCVMELMKKCDDVTIQLPEDQRRNGRQDDDAPEATTDAGTTQAPNTITVDEKCEEWPVQKCTLEKRSVKKVHPETACRKIPREVCAPNNCALAPGEEVCRDESRMQMQNVPEEDCDLQPEETCHMEAVLVPRLVPKPNCVKVPKEICVNSKTNPRVVKKPVIKEWCYRPSDLAQTPGVTPPTPDEVRSFFY